MRALRFATTAVLLLPGAAMLGQTITEFPIPTTASSPLAITAGPDGALWFTESVANKIGRITTAGVITEFPIPTASSDPRGITAGPDAAIWFTERAANQIGRISTDGTITEFSIPTSGALPLSIVSGADGALWFVENGPSAVGRITTAGSYTETPITGGGPWASAIASGPDGNLWLTAAGPTFSGVIRVTLSGIATSFPVPVTLALPSISGGPDGDVWFARKAGTLPTVTTGVVHRLTVSGSDDGNVTLPMSYFAGSVAPGSDGNMWATKWSPSAVGIARITPALTITVFPATGDPDSITPGSDGALWYTNEPNNTIGRITTGVTPGAMSFYSLAPCRLADTRQAATPLGPAIEANRTRTLRVGGKCGIPATATGLSLNVTVAQPTQDGHLVLYSGVGAGPLPSSSLLNYRPGKTRANNAVVSLGGGASLYVFCGQTSGAADVIVDVNGYFQ